MKEEIEKILVRILAKSHTTDDARQIRYWIKEEYLALQKEKSNNPALTNHANGVGAINLPTNPKRD